MKIEYVVGFLINRDLKTVPLIRKTKPAWQRGLYNGIGGKIESGETPKEAMTREFEEEAGVRIEDWEQTVILEFADAIVYFFRSFTKAHVEKDLTEEHVDIFYYDSLPSNCIPNLRWLIPLQLENVVWPIRLSEKYND